MNWVNAVNRKCCPVCKFHKSYAGPICPACVAVGYAVQKDGKIKRKVS